jgi:hypothetical protein
MNDRPTMSSTNFLMALIITIIGVLALLGFFFYPNW